MKSLFIFFSLLMASASQAATILCEGKVDFYGEIQKFTVAIDGRGIGQAYTPSTVEKIVVQGASLEQPNVFTNAVDYWDGHSSGMITAPGFSMSYEQAFGCIRNVVITTDFRGDVKNMGQTVGHITQSQVIAVCDNGKPLCLNH